MLSVRSGLRCCNDLHVGRKIANIHLFFQSKEQVVFRRGEIRRKVWVIKTLETEEGQLLLGCNCPVSKGIVVQETESLGKFPAGFSFKMSLNCTNRDE